MFDIQLLLFFQIKFFTFFSVKFWSSIVFCCQIIMFHCFSAKFKYSICFFSVKFRYSAVFPVQFLIPTVFFGIIILEFYTQLYFLCQLSLFNCFFRSNLDVQRFFCQIKLFNFFLSNLKSILVLFGRRFRYSAVFSSSF